MRNLFISLLLFTICLSYGQINNEQIDNLIERAIIKESQSPLESQKMALEAIKLANKNHYQIGEIKALLFISESFVRTKENKKALYYADLAEKIILDTQYFYKSVAIRLKGISFARLGFFHTSLKTLSESSHYAAMIEDENDRKTSYGFIYGDIAENYLLNQKNSDSALFYYEKSYDFFTKTDSKKPEFQRYKAFALANFGSFYMDVEKYDAAEKYLVQALNISQKYNLDFISIEALTDLGKLNYRQHNFELAKKNYQKALNIANNKQMIFYIDEIYKNLSKTFFSLNEIDSSNYYVDRHIALEEQINELNKSGVNMSLHMLVNEQEKKYKGVFLSLQVVIVLCVMILIFFVVIYFRYYKINAAIREKAIEFNSRLVNKRQIIEQLDHLDPKSKEEELEDLKVLAQKNSPLFIVKFKNVEEEFCNTLIEKFDLTINELKFCAYLRLNFTSKEIATYAKISMKAIESRKYRLRKKAGLSPDDDIYVWISTI